jgi:putative protein-disulfide isomerase
MEKQILYLFDPLCGWCYGFSDTIYQFSEKYAGQFEFVPIPGGMVTGDRVGPVAKKEDYISGALERVEKMTGCKFGEKYKNGLQKKKTTMMDPEPPSRALITFRTFNLAKSISFAKSLQKAHYYDGMDYNEESWYGDLAAEFGIDRKVFMDRFSELKMKQHVQEEFVWVRESGVQGYPSVVLRKGQKYFMISNGYIPLSELESSLKKADKRLS